MARFGLVFPGQGSQHPGMMQDLYEHDQGVRDLFAEAGAALGRDLAALCFSATRETLDLTIHTQIAVLTADLAAWRAFSRRVAQPPLVMAGHSLGEYAALQASGAVGLKEVLGLVQTRAQYHQEAVPVGAGAMAAVIGLSREAVADLCREGRRSGEAVDLAIENTAEQFVVSGHTSAVDRVVAAANQREGGRAVRLAISVPCHSPLLAGAAERFAETLKEVAFGDGQVPVIPNSAPERLHSREATPALLASQIVSPVRWVETIRRMAAMGVETIVELGPQRILSGLIRRIDRRIALLNVEDCRSLERTVAALAARA